MPASSVSERYALTESDPHEQRDSLATAVAEGLSDRPRSLPCRFLYDELGSELFEAICELPEYYLTRAEHQLLRDHADDVVAHLPEVVTLAELGSGSSTKTRLLIEALLRRQRRLRYVPVDISRSMLEESAEALLADYGALEIHAIASEYQVGLRHVRNEKRVPKVIAWLGSNVGNFDRAAAARFLHGIRDVLQPEDRLLLGIDLRKERRVLEAAYDDDAGVTARFNLNLLTRINRELDADFDLAGFRHYADWREQEGRVELGLECLDGQQVSIKALDLSLRFERGERIHTEDSYKYSFEEIAGLADAAGLRVAHRWLDASGAYSLQLLEPA
ncbi:MAG: L-histidine N(alpha)-methyltransferase [Myxococcota bacterium]